MLWTKLWTMLHCQTTVQPRNQGQGSQTKNKTKKKKNAQDEGADDDDPRLVVAHDEPHGLGRLPYSSKTPVAPTPTVRIVWGLAAVYDVYTPVREVRVV